MTGTEKITPVAAVLAALGTMVCCLPIGFLGAAGLAAASEWSGRLRWWLLGGSLALLAVGFVQLYGGRRACRRRGRVSVALLWIATALVLAIVLFPQLVAGLLAR